MENYFGGFPAKMARAWFRRFDFVKFMENLAGREPGAAYAASGESSPAAFSDEADIARLAAGLAERALAEKGEPINRKELESQAAIISCRYDPKLHQTLRAAAVNIISQLFESKSFENLFTSADLRELANAGPLKKARAEGRGVVYLINHSSHWDEFIFNVFLDQNGLGLPLFAAGQNMMATPSLEKLFMTGSYVILRSGASRAYLSTLYHYCQALGETGKSQGIFLEAWSGGARTRDGSLRYPRRLIALQGALAARNDVLVQPVVISYSRVPEDLGLSEGRGMASWLNGHHILGEMLKRPWQPKESAIRGLKNLYGRTYVGFGRGRLVSELAEEMERDPASELTIDEYASLYAIREIARDKKIMAPQLAARALLKTKKAMPLIAAAEAALSEIRDYHQKTFGCEPDLEDFLREHPLDESLADGLKSLRARRVTGRRHLGSDRPKIRSPHGLAYYATHGDRRLYSPSARENFVVCGSGPWAFGLVSYLGRRTLGDKKYNNASLSMYDGDEALMAALAYDRGSVHFPDQRLPKNVFPTHDHTAAFRKATEVIVATPPDRVEEILGVILNEAPKLRSLIIASRGFDPRSHRLTVQIAWDAAKDAGRADISILALSGPFSPQELLGEEGGMWTLAGPVKGGRGSEALLFKWGKFRVSSSPDPMGVQMGAALSDAYSLYGLYINRGWKTRSPLEVAAFIREVSAEAKALALALGAQPQSFEADSPAWMSEFIIRSMRGTPPSQHWLNELRANKAGAELMAARADLYKTWPDPWCAAYFSIHSAALTARALGLALPHLEEADKIFWG